MNIEDHETTLQVFDEEEHALMTYIESLEDKESQEYRNAINALKILQEVKKNENEMEIAKLKQSLDEARMSADVEIRKQELEMRKMEHSTREAQLELDCQKVDADNEHRSREIELRERELSLREAQLSLDSRKLDIETARSVAEIEKGEGETKLRKRIAWMDFAKGMGAMALLTAGTLVIRHGEMTGEAVFSGNAKQEVRGLASGLLPKPR